MGDIVYLNKYINTILEQLYSNNTICKLLYYDTPNALTSNNLDDNTILFTDLSNRRIYPMVYTMENMDIPKSMLYIDVSNASLDKKNIFFKDVCIEITILSHLDLWELTNDESEYSNLRINRLVHELNTLFHQKRVIGLGKMLFDVMQKVYVDRVFSGYKISFQVVDFLE